MLNPIVDVRSQEVSTLLLMFGYGFVAMAAYNIVKPVTRSEFITSLSADRLPIALLAAGVLTGVVMQAYGRLSRLVAQQLVIPLTELATVVALVGFWALFRATEGAWVSVALYFFGKIVGILLISHFWTLADVAYDARQAKRLFGFIGAGSMLGGVAGGLIALASEQIGTRSLLLCGAAGLAISAGISWHVIRQLQPEDLSDAHLPSEARGVGGKEGLHLLRESPHLRTIAAIIGLAAVGAVLIEQQLNMAVESFKGRAATDAMTAFLGQVTVYTSTIGFLIQIWLTSRIHHYLGIGAALLMLPLSLGATGVVILLNAALWAPTLGRVLDQSLRYSVDKTTREILFLPLSASLKYRAKPFVDVTVDRVAQGIGALALSVMIFGLGLDWQQLSYASLLVTGLWIAMAIRARRRYLAAFRQSIEHRDVQAGAVRLSGADLSTIETLVEELGHTDAQRVLYAIDLLEALDKRNLITPLLLRHEAAAVRVRALAALGAARADIAQQWLPTIQSMVADHDPSVRAAAIAALANIQSQDAQQLARELVEDESPRIVTAAATALAASDLESDRRAAERALSRLVFERVGGSEEVRRDVAAAIRHTADPRFRHLLIPLLHDSSSHVVQEALRSVRELREPDPMLVPALVTLLRHRGLKSGWGTATVAVALGARDVLVGYGEPVVGALGYFLRDASEDIWVRRRIPTTVARIACQASVDLLIAALDEPDALLRSKVVAGLEKLRQQRPDLGFDRQPIERRTLEESRVIYRHLTRSAGLFGGSGSPGSPLLAKVLEEQTVAGIDRIYSLLGLLIPWRDAAAARAAIESGQRRARAAALEYLDNILTGTLRQHVMPLLEHLPLEERVRRGHAILRTRPRDAEETLLDLINDEDPVVVATAVGFVRQVGLRSLAPDLEHVRSHAGRRSREIAEAVDWVLRGWHEAPGQRPALEPLPTVELVDHMRHLAMFASVGVDELFRMAGAGRQIRHVDRSTLLKEGVTPEVLHVLLMGKVTTTARGSVPGDIGAPALLGFEELIGGRPMRQTIRTADAAMSLEITREAGLTLLADNTSLVQGLFRTLAEQSSTVAQRVVVKGTGGPSISQPIGGRLTPIQKVLALQRVPVFSRVSAEEMLEVARIAHEIPLRSGAVLSEATDPPVLCFVLSGELALVPSDGSSAPGARPQIAGEGDAVGIYETLAGTLHGAVGRAPLRLVVSRDGVALRVEREDLFDLIAHSPGLLRHLFVALFETSPAR